MTLVPVPDPPDDREHRDADTPIYDGYAEQFVLGAMMCDAHTIDAVTEVLAGPEFLQPRHESIFIAILAAHRAQLVPDMLVVAKHLGADLAKAGGPGYLHSLVAGCPIPAQAEFYARRVADVAVCRGLDGASAKIRQLARSAGDVATIAQDARAAVDEAAAGAKPRDTGVDVASLLDSTLEELDTGIDPGLATGWADIDFHVNGLRSGQLAIVGARPSVGKSVVAANLAAAACRAGVGVHFATLEMTRGEVMRRMLSAQATVALHRLMNHDLADDDWQRLSRHQSAIRAWPLYVDDSPSQSLVHLRAAVRTTSRRLPLGLVIVDYVQLMAPRDRRAPREQQVGELSEGLKVLAKEFGVPVVALAQVNRGPMERQSKLPMMSDLRESGRIEADADHIWMLHRPDLTDPASCTGELLVSIAKNRNGSAGAVVTLAFQGHYSRAVSQARPSEVYR